jgi:predicted nucleic acid-binding protein
MDDRTGRNATTHSGFTVIGIVDLLEQAVIHGLIELSQVMDRLCQINLCLDPN